MSKFTRRAFAAVAGAVAMTLTAGAGMAQSVNLTAETASPGNSPHLSAVHMGKVLSREGVANMQVTEGQTITNSILNVAEGKTDYTTAPLVLTFLLKAGRGPYSKQGENGAALADNLRALFPYNAGGYGMIAFQSTGIEKWSDIEGRTVFNGPPRGAALVNARQSIQANTGFEDGKQYKGVQANWGQLPSMLLDGSADAFVVPLTMPSSRITTMLSAGKINLLSTPKDIFESEKFQRMLKAPGNVPIEIARADLGHGDDVNLISEDGVFRAMGTAFADVVHKDMDFELAKAITATHIATLDELKASSPYAPNVNFGVLDAETSGFCGAMPLKYHPGAVAAWEEAGYTVPDCAK